MKNLSLFTLALFSILLFTSCGGGSSTGPTYENESGQNNGGSGSGSGDGSGSGSGDGSGSGSGDGSGSGNGGATYNYSVTIVSTNSGNKYAIDGTLSASLNLDVGSTYIFTTNGGGHPFRLSSTQDGTHGGGSSLSDGVSINGSVLTFVVPSSLSGNTLHYFCTLHAGMGGGTLTIN
jgi:hypothetical protein